MTGGAGPAEITLEAIEAARPAVQRIAVHTRMFPSRVLSELTGSRIVLKAENLQPTGSFKIRGASAKLAALGSGALPGIVVASAGNHAQAAALAARSAGVRCEVYMPAEASISKAEATIGYGARSTSRATRSTTVSCWLRNGPGRPVFTSYTRSTIRPSWQGRARSASSSSRMSTTLAMVIVPLGGGGLVSGIACAVDALRRRCKLWLFKPQCVLRFLPHARATGPLASPAARHLRTALP